MTAFIVEWIARGGYWGIFLLMALENVVPPVPSEVIMGLGGMAVGRGEMRFGWLVLAGTIGTVLGNYPWYWLGRRYGAKGLRPLQSGQPRICTYASDERSTRQIGFMHEMVTGDVSTHCLVLLVPMLFFFPSI